MLYSPFHSLVMRFVVTLIESYLVYGDFLSPMQQPHSYYNAMECGIVYLFLPINARENRQKTMEKRHLEKDFA